MHQLNRPQRRPPNATASGRPPRVLVTGAGGAIGLAAASALARQGAAIAITDRDRGALRNAAEMLEGLEPAALHQVPMDQTEHDAVRRGIEAAVDGLDGLDGLVANAGYAKFAPMLSVSREVWDRHVAVNLTGTMFVCQAAARAMVDQGTGGSIVVTASTLARGHADQVGPYCVTKAGVLMLVESMAAELGVHGIRVNTVLPGVVESAMTRTMLDWPGTRENLLAQTPLGRLADPEDVAEAISYLLSHRAAYVTGTELRVDGGQAIYGQPRWLQQDRTDPSGDRWLTADGTYWPEHNPPTTRSGE